MGLSQPAQTTENQTAVGVRAVERTLALKWVLLSLWGTSIISLYARHRPELAAFGIRLLDHLIHIALLLALIIILYALGRRAARLFCAPPHESADHLGPERHAGAWPGVHPLAHGGLSTAFCIGLGFGIVSLLMFLLGLAQLYYTWTGYLILCAGLMLAWRERYAAARWLHQARQSAGSWDWPERLLLGLLLLVLLLGLACSLAPPFLGDDMVYHLNTPKTYLRHHKLVDIPFNIYTYFPMGTEMLYTLALMVKGDVPAKLLHYAMGALILLAIYSICRHLGLSRRLALLATLFFCTVPTVWFLMSWAAYVDLTLTFFLLLAVVAYIQAWHSSRREWLWLCGMFYGFAMGTKFTALYMLPVLFFALVLRVRQNLLESGPDGPPILPTLSAQVLWPITLAILIAAPWYSKNLYYTGNPFFPFFLNFFPVRHVGWDAERAANYMVVLSHYGRSVKSWASFLLLPWDLTMRARLIEPQFHDGILGPLFLMILPAFFLRGAKPAAVRILGGFALIYFLAWALSSQQMRFLLPLLPALCIMSAYALSDTRPDPSPRIAPWRAFFLTLTALAVLGNAAVISYYFARVDPLPYLFGQESRDEYLSRNLDYYNLYSHINKTLPPSSKVFLIDMGNFGYYLDREYFSDSIFEDHTIGKLVNQSRSAGEVRTRLRAMGVTHLLYCHTILLNKDLMPFDAAGLPRFMEFLRQEARLLKSDRNFQLWEIKHD